jgi:hypothetical protein
MMVWLVAVQLLSSTPAENGGGGNVYALPDAEFVAQAKRDLSTVHLYADGLRRLQQTLGQNAGLLNRREKVPYTPEQKAMLLSTWGAFFSYFISIEAIRQRYQGFVKAAPTDTLRHLWGFALTHLALTTELAHGLTFAHKFAGNPQLEVLLDEPNAEFGVPLHAFADLKKQAIHVSTATKLFAGDAYSKDALPRMRKHGLMDVLELAWAVKEMQLSSKVARDELKYRGVELFTRQAGDILKDSTLGAIFPVQKEVAEWMGDTRVRRIGQPLIKREQALALTAKMEPGDILVARQNWFLSNIGLPGFWPHAELYLGTPDALSAYFDGDAEVKQWVASQKPGAETFTAFLQAKWPEKYQQYATGKDLLGNGPIRVIESISEGVSFTSIEHAMMVDYLGVMRPRLPKLEKARAIARAFAYQGRPYDFDFDFLSDAGLVCTELVWKSYAPSADVKGLALPLVEVAGRQTLPANEIIRRFDLELDSPNRQLDFVAFLDGRESNGDAVLSDVAAFRRSHTRLKWDVAQ